jgi:hypothetical protein
VQVASQHAEAIGESSRISVKKRFLFDGITLHSADISPGNIELSTLIESDLADPGLAFSDWATVSAGIATQPVTLDGFVQLALADVLIQDFVEG